MDSRECPVCARGARLRFTDVQGGVEYTVWHCAACDILFPHPRPTVAGAPYYATTTYADEYYVSTAPEVCGYSDYVEHDHLNTLTSQRRMQYLQDLLPPPPANLFEVGCASGAFLEVMQAQGYAVGGIEVSEGMARIAAGRLKGAPVVCGRIEDLERPSPWPVDILAAWDVIEHLVQPVEALRQWSDWLKPGGLLLLETQNWGALATRVFGKRWIRFKHGEHLFHFTPRGIGRMLQPLGLSVLRVSASGSGRYVSVDVAAYRIGKLFPPLGPVARAWAKWRGPDAAIWTQPWDQFLLVARRDR